MTLAMHDPGNDNVNQFVDTVSAFMVDLFRFCLAKKSNGPLGPPPNPPPHVSAQLLSEIKQIVDMLVTAYLRVVYIETWNLEEYCRDCIEKRLRDGMYSDREKAMSDQWGTWIPGTRVRLQSPRMIADRYGRVMAWILPNVLPPRIQVALFDAAKLCEPWLARKYNKYLR
ncbi:hypothetical protein K474DRAFT_1710551 [Panus rudis PR-1116 ss-1]|nr:hypothetical protein K474DRAFT_1710551 [Panus rudis PR-1116 ss-1]